MADEDEMEKYRVDESFYKTTNLIGLNCENVEVKIKRLVDLIFEEKHDSEMFDFFDIRGTVLLYGIPGVGKTTLVKNISNYAVHKECGVETYRIKASDIITSDLGESAKNLSLVIKNFEKLEQGILFIDEIDGFCINRNKENELSELHRVLIEFMMFIDGISVNSKKMVIGCTNMFEQMDPAMKRRFAICEEIDKPTNDEKRVFFDLCCGKVGISIKKNISDERLSKFETMDSIKSFFRNKILTNKMQDILEE